MSRACLTANQMSFIDNLLGRAICGMTASAARPLPVPPSLRQVPKQGEFKLLQLSIAQYIHIG